MKTTNSERGHVAPATPCLASSPRLLILRQSLEKKEKQQSQRLDEHFADVKRANGQPLNDKRNGAATLNRWENQNSSLRNLEESIERTKAAIEREETKISHVESVDIPQAIRDAIDAGEITQWRKHPRMFFVVGVDRGRITWDEETKTLGHRYLSEVPKEQYPTFRDAYNKLRSQTMKTNQITPSTRRRANGWQATLEFPNGGIQAFSSLYGSMGEAARAANGLLTARLANPGSCVPDPAPNMLMER